MKPQRIKTAYGWAWAMEWVEGPGNWSLCHWAQPDRARLVGEAKPSPEAKPTAVAILPRAEYRELKRKARLFDALQKGGPHAK